MAEDLETQLSTTNGLELRHDPIAHDTAPFSPGFWRSRLGRKRHGRRLIRHSDAQSRRLYDQADLEGSGIGRRRESSVRSIRRKATSSTNKKAAAAARYGHSG